MNIIQRLFNNKKDEKRGYLTDLTNYNPLVGSINLLNGSNYAESKSLKISAVYRAVNVIGDSVAVLPLDTYRYKDNWKYKEYNQLWNLLNIAPNSNMSASTMKKMIVQNILLKGNCYIYINRDTSNNIQSLELLDSSDVQVVLVNGFKKYQQISTTRLFDDFDIIHIMNYSVNGLVGVSTLSYASMSLATAYNSEEYASNFFAGGGAMAGILKPIAGTTLNDEKAEKLKNSITDKLSANVDGGVSNSIIVLGAGVEYQPISISPKDAQLLESRQFNILSIAQWFGVPPAKLFDLSKATYASAEASQIDFLNSTLLPLLEKIENEIYRKIYLPVEYATTELKFDVQNLLRLDQNTQADVFTKYINSGIMTVNEVRERLNLNFPAVGGNRLFIGQNLQPLDNILNDIKNNNTNKE